MKSPQPQDPPAVASSRPVTDVIDRLPVLVQEEAVFACRQVVPDANVRESTSEIDRHLLRRLSQTSA
jgi:hypothetical protein